MSDYCSTACQKDASPHKFSLANQALPDNQQIDRQCPTLGRISSHKVAELLIVSGQTGQSRTRFRGRIALPGCLSIKQTQWKDSMADQTLGEAGSVMSLESDSNSYDS